MIVCKLRAKESNNSLVGIIRNNRTKEDLLEEVLNMTGDEYYIESSEEVDDDAELDNETTVGVF